jgi:tetratricopeptide (TPR) repeat protein
MVKFACLCCAAGVLCLNAEGQIQSGLLIPPASVSHFEPEYDPTVPMTERESPWGLAPSPNTTFDSPAPAPNVRPEANSDGNVVSVEELRHPISRKGQRLLEDAQKELSKGSPSKAIDKLQKAAAEPSASGYARGLLGTVYLRMGKLKEAVTELQEAVRIRPWLSALHTNLGNALCHMGQCARGEREIHEALRIDKDSPQARFLMGVILLDQTSRRDEARAYLESASGQVRAARLALAVSYARTGQKAEEHKELLAYLGAGRDGYLPVLDQWASAAAAMPHVGRIFGMSFEAAE